MPPYAPDKLTAKRKSLDKAEQPAAKRSKGSRPPVVVANDFVALPFQLDSAVHHIYARPQEPQEDEDWPEGRSLFVASLPGGSSRADVESAFASLTGGEVESTHFIATGRVADEQRRTLLDTEGLHIASSTDRRPIHPLFTSLDSAADLAALRPQHAAVIIFASSSSVADALRVPASPSPALWPATTLTSIADLHARTHPSLADVRRHTDEWMAAFEKREALLAALPPPEPVAPAKRAAVVVGSDEDDGGGWTLVKRGGTHGRSLLPTAAPDADEPVDRAFATGLPSVHVASRAFERKTKEGVAVAVDPRQEKKRAKQAQLMEGFYRFQRDEQRQRSASLCAALVCPRANTAQTCKRCATSSRRTRKRWRSGGQSASSGRTERDE
jgi:hypothetical protein